MTDYVDAVEHLSRLIAGDDERRFLVIFCALVNQVDEFAARPGDAGLLVRGGRRAAGSPPPEASLSTDPVFLRNAHALIRDRERIVGGVPTDDYPDCVAVGSADQWCCSGTLVAPNVVVTAGHCVSDGCAARVFVGADVSFPADGQIVPVARAVPHPDYRPPRLTQDIAVLVLAEPVAGEPRAVAGPELLRDASSVRLAGYGNTDVFSSGGFGRRRMVDVPMAGSNPAYGADDATEFVAGAPFLNRDSCNGDSGGPAYVRADGKWYLAGATSRATASTYRPCGDGGIYTRAASYLEWIRAVPGGRW